MTMLQGNLTTSSASVSSSPWKPPAAAAAVSPAKTLAVATYGTLLVLVTFSALVATVGDSGRSLHAGVAGQTWALSGMSLGLAMALLTVGALADDFGRRRVLVSSAVGLVVTSGLGALAPTIGILVAARVLQGIAGAGVVAASLGSIGQAFPTGPRRTYATGVWAAAVGGGIALGPLAGGALAASLGWRSSFWLEAVAAAVLVPAAATLSESRSSAARPLDLPAVVTLGVAMACLTAGLVEGRTSWSSVVTLALLAGGALLLAAFARIELGRPRPMIELRLFGEPQFVASITGALFTGLAVIGLMSYSPTLMQRALHMSVITSAGVLAVWSTTSVVVALAARRLPGRLQSPTRLAIGLALCALGELALTGLGARTSWTGLVPGLLIAGVGSGIANAALGRLAVESVPHEQAGMGSGANNTARYLGGAAGVAVVVALSPGGATRELIHGWNTAAFVCAGLCLLGALVAASCRAGEVASVPQGSPGAR
jgi:MFS family permease